MTLEEGEDVGLDTFVLALACRAKRPVAQGLIVVGRSMRLKSDARKMGSPPRTVN